MGTVHLLHGSMVLKKTVDKPYAEMLAFYIRGKKMKGTVKDSSCTLEHIRLNSSNDEVAS